MSENEKEFTSEGRAVIYDEQGKAYTLSSVMTGGIRTYLDEEEYPPQAGPSEPEAPVFPPPIDMRPMAVPMHAAPAQTVRDEVNDAKVAAAKAAEEAEAAKNPSSADLDTVAAETAAKEQTEAAPAALGLAGLAAVEPGAPTSAQPEATEARS